MLPSPAVRPVGERFAGLPLRFAAPTLAAAALCFCALFLSGGFDDAALVWIGGLALALAALTAAAAQVGPLPAPRVDARAAAFLGCLFGLAAWAGLSTLWSVSPDRSWAYTNRTLVYAAFALLGVLLSALIPRVRTRASRTRCPRPTRAAARSTGPTERLSTPDACRR